MDLVDDIRDMVLKIYRTDREVLIAVCDRDLLGKTFEDGKLQLDINPGFYGQDAASLAEIEAALHEATIANFAGSRAVSCAISLGYVDRGNVLEIAGVPCAQMVRM